MKGRGERYRLLSADKKERASERERERERKREERREINHDGNVKPDLLFIFHAKDKPCNFFTIECGIPKP